MRRALCLINDLLDWKSTCANLCEAAGVHSGAECSHLNVGAAVNDTVKHNHWLRCLRREVFLVQEH